MRIKTVATYNLGLELQLEEWFRLPVNKKVYH